MERPEPVRPDGKGGWLMKVWVQPGAKKSELAGLYQGCVKVRLGAPAVDNKANKALVRFMAKVLGLKVRQVSLRDGQASRCKTLLIETEQEPRWENLVSVSADNQ
ncbi:MAG: DUF167 domain-containing protein [Desulfovibrionaceae bacterium]